MTWYRMRGHDGVEDGGRETGGRDTGGRETGGRETGGREIGGREIPEPRVMEFAIHINFTQVFAFQILQESVARLVDVGPEFAHL